MVIRPEKKEDEKNGLATGLCFWKESLVRGLEMFSHNHLPVFHLYRLAACKVWLV